MHRKYSKAQSLIEYVTLISLVSIAFMALFPLAKRGIQSVIAAGADQIGNQPKDQPATSKYLSASNTDTTTTSKPVLEQASGQITYRENDNKTIRTSTWSAIK